MMGTRDATAVLCALLLGAAVAACDGGDAGGGDAGPDAGADPDGGAPDALYPACEELAAPSAVIGEIPGAVSGDLERGDADMVSPGACAEQIAPFGVESAGPDEVIALTGLAEGTPYAVRLQSDDDLGFYIVTGCSTEAGPADDECLLFVDGVTDGLEVGRFVAPGDTVYVVVDYYDSQAPEAGGFALDIYQAECDDDDVSACEGAQPLCDDFRCVSCATDFDCSSALAPVCNPQTGTCSAGSSACVGDDGAPRENADDGPAGATDLTPTVGDSKTITGKICDAPTGEADFAAFTVEEDGESWQVDLAWDDAGVDLDLLVFDAEGELLGLSYYERPEGIALTYLPAGTYYIVVDHFAPVGVAETTPYALTTTRTTGTACEDVADCADDYEHQIYRGTCDDGACVAIAGAGTLDVGDACDSQSDCAPGRYCPSFFFVSDADTRNICTLPCNNDGDCEAMGDAFVCTDFLVDNFCYERCSEVDHCPALPSVEPDVPPWYRLTCTPDGHCEL